MDSKSIQRLKDLDRDRIWHPFTPMQVYQEEDPLIVSHAEGCYLFDIEGNRYLDGVASLWVNVHGHRHPTLDRAIAEQLGRVAHSTLLGASNVPAVEFAERLLKIAPAPLAKVFYSDSGSTAVEIAIKMAFQYWQQRGGDYARKTRFVTLENAYHGDTLGSVSVGGIDTFHKIFKPLLFDSHIVPGFDLEAATRVFREKHAELAACIVEPMIQGAAGMRLQPPGFLSALRKLCDEHEVLLICDEVATGFGRTGKMFAVEHEGVKPDFLCLAKGITGGYLPLAATLTTEEVFSRFLGKFEEFRTFFHGHSYTGNPLACAAALANLQIFEDEKVLESLPGKISVFYEGLAPFLEHPNVREIRQLGMMLGIELAESSGTPFPASRRVAYQVCRRARKFGVLIRPLGDVLVLLPPLAISPKQIRELVGATYRAFEEVLREL